MPERYTPLPVNPTPEQVVEHFKSLTPEEQYYYELALNPIRKTKLLMKHEQFVNEYTVDFNLYRAARAVGYKNINKNDLLDIRKHPDIVNAIAIKLKEREVVSDLKADYVRDYIQTVLEFCPTDYFIPAPEGGWMVPVENYDHIPHQVKRLIEDVEWRQIRGSTFIAVKFVSKTAALAMAAKYTLTQSAAVQPSKVCWDDLAFAEKVGHDDIDERLKAEESIDNASILR